MRNTISKLATLALGTALLVGCGTTQKYIPQAKPIESMAQPAPAEKPTIWPILGERYVVRNDLPGIRGPTMFLTKEEDFKNASSQFYLDPTNTTPIYFPVPIMNEDGKTMTTSYPVIDLDFIGREIPGQAEPEPVTKTSPLIPFKYNGAHYINSAVPDWEQTETGFWTTRNPEIIPEKLKYFGNNVYRFRNRIKTNDKVLGWKKIPNNKWHELIQKHLKKKNSSNN